MCTYIKINIKEARIKKDKTKLKTQNSYSEPPPELPLNDVGVKGSRATFCEESAGARRTQ